MTKLVSLSHGQLLPGAEQLDFGKWMYIKAFINLYVTNDRYTVVRVMAEVYVGIDASVYRVSFIKNILSTCDNI